jgi:hypothetical protein
MDHEAPQERVVLPFVLNGVERAMPLRLAPAGVAAALCEAARLACEQGFEVEVRNVPVLVARVSLPTALASARVQRRIAALAGDLLQLGMDAAAQAWVPIGCIPGLYLCGSPSGGMEAHVHSERVDAPGAKVLRTVADALARPLMRLAECADAAPSVTLCELQHQRVEARCRIAASALFDRRFAGRAQGREAAVPRADLLRELALEHHDPPLAVAHNARVIEAMLGASAALGVDPGVWEGEARRHAGRWGSCEPLVRWRWLRGELIGELRLPVRWGDAPARMAPRAGASSEASADMADMKDAMMRLACVALAASLAFSAARWRARAAGPLSAPPSPPPLPAADVDRRSLPGKRSFESGVRAAVQPGGRARAG